MSSSYMTQLQLCLWKHWLLKKRQPITFLVQILFPVFMVLILFLIKLSVPPSDFDTCQFRARAGPSAGLMAMFQSFACNIQNNCGDLKDFEDLPTYPGSKLNILVKHLEPVVYNDTIKQINIAVPNILKLLNGTARALNNTKLDRVISRTTFITDVFDDITEAKNILTTNDEYFDSYTADALLSAILRMGMITGDLASLGFSLGPDGICSNYNIKKLLPDIGENFTNMLEEQICGLEEGKQREFIKLLQQGIDVIKLKDHYEYFTNMIADFTDNGMLKAMSQARDDLQTIGLRIRKKREIDYGVEKLKEVLDIVMSPDKTEVFDLIENIVNDLLQSIANGKENCYKKFLSAINCSSVFCIGEEIEDRKVQDIIGTSNSDDCAFKEMIKTIKALKQVYRIAMEKLSVWKSFDELPLNNDLNTTSTKLLKTCLINVEEFIAGNMEPLEVIKCKKEKVLKRQAEESKLQILKTSVNITGLDELLEQWKHEKLLSLNWTTELEDAISKILQAVIEISSELQSFATMIQSSSLDLDTIVGFALSSPKLASIMESIVTVLNNTEVLFKNTDLGQEFQNFKSWVENSRVFAISSLKPLKLIQIFDNWDVIQTFLGAHTILESVDIKTLAESDISSQVGFLVFSQLASLNNYLCNEDQFSRYIELYDQQTVLNVTVKTISEAFCNFISSPLSVEIVKTINMKGALDYAEAALMLAPTSLAKMSNLTLIEFDDTIKRIVDAETMYPILSEITDALLKEINVTEIVTKLNVTDVGDITMEDVPKIMNFFICGEKLEPAVEIKHKPLHPTGNDSVPDTPQHLDDGCSAITDQLDKTWAGRVIWRFLEKIFRGDILYTPENTITREIMQKANYTFMVFDEFRSYVQPFGMLFVDMKHIEEYQEHAEIMTQLFFSNFFEDLSKSNIKETYDMDLEEFIDQNITEACESIQETLPLLEVTFTLGRSLSCMKTDRMISKTSEEEILLSARNSSSEFLAGVVLVDNSTNNWTKLPEHIHYIIRMDVDSVPLSSDLKEKMWVPGPDGDMYYNMRYFWGFSQIQDMMDNAIIELQSGTVPSDGVYLQQFPYPCFKRDNFNSGLYTAQILQVAFIFGYSAVVAIAVREFIWERESKNSQIIQVMGISSGVMWLSNFLVMMFIILLDALLLTLFLSLGKLLPFSSPFIIFSLLVVYGISIIMFIFLLSVIMQKSTSGSVGAFLLFILTFIPFIVIISLNEQVSLVIKVLSNLFMSTSFGFSLLYMTRYEQQGIGMHWDNMEVSPIEDDKMNFVICFAMLLVDTLLYGLLAFFVTRFSSLDGSFDKGSSGRHRSRINSYVSQVENPDGIKGIAIQGLRKVYKLSRKSVRVAVNNLDIVFKENEITGLLGHNGAGKSTTIGMLTGMVTPTKGKVYINGLDINADWDRLKRITGFCPQHSILYSNMSTKEHLQFYARLKSENKDTEEDVMAMLDSMNIMDKADVPCKDLSEGLRRRLSVGIAFIGSTKIVILDEPTSGVDPKARKYIWDLILKYRQNRTILVSTHYMDEAEILCDKIAIMHKGQLQKFGTCLELQVEFGSELKLNIYSDSELQTEVSSVTSSSTGLSPSLFTPDQIDFQINKIAPTAQKISQSFRKRTYNLPVKEAVNFSVYQKLFAILENEKDLLNVSSFSITSPSLEDIFLAIVWEADASDDILTISEKKVNSKQISPEKGIEDSSLSSLRLNSPTNLNRKFEVDYQTNIALFLNQLFALLLKRSLNFIRDKKLIISSFIIPMILLILAMTTAKIRPQTKTPSILLTPSMYGPGSASFISQISKSNIGEALMNPPGIGTTCMNSLLPIADYTTCSPINKGVYQNQSIPVYEEECSCTKNSWQCSASSNHKMLQRTRENTTDIVYHLPDDIHPNDWILNTHFEFIERRYGGWKFDLKRNVGDKVGLTVDNSVVYFNNKGFHSVAAYLNAVNNARLRKSVVDEKDKTQYGITTYSHPIRESSNQVTGQSLIQHISDYSLALLMLTVVTFVPTSTIVYLIQERTSEEKLVQRTFGVGPITYWTASLIWDTFISLIFLALSSVIIQLFQVRSFTERSNFSASLLLMFVFCMTSNAFIYLAEKRFKEPSMGQIILLTSFIFLGLIFLVLMLLLFMFWWIKPLQDAKKILEVILLVFPPYALGNVAYIC